MRYSRVVSLTIGLLLAGLSAPRAWGQETFYRGLFRGLSRLSQPTAPSGQRFGQFRVSREPFPDGWRFTFNRSFGPDAFGYPDRIDLGPLDLTFNSGTVRWQGQFSQRGIPSVEFEAVTPVPLNYTLSFDTGFQELSIENAQLAYATDWNINALGFYDYLLTVSHRGEFDIDGMLIVDSGSLDFDIGPVNMSGHVLGDALAVLTAPLFATTENPFTKFSGRATKRIEAEETRSALTARARSGEILTEEDMDDLVEATLIAAALDGTAPDFSYLADEAFASTLEDLDVVLAEDTDGTGNGVVADQSLLVPEPTTATLLIMASAILLIMRRRR
ncbi:MAG: hypothetical protein JSU68_12370 [Phycisphaerales bacterium]|nr:MAG: hypothetical protein JSU68_12370 [Phycisphaerales bacterium]